MSAPAPANRRWPLHPRPGPHEALSSWLARLAGCYELSIQDLLRHNLGPAGAALATNEPEALDWDPPTALLDALTTCTGVEFDQLRAMTLAGWIPWLLETLVPADTGDAQVLFDTYVRQHSVLLNPSEAGRNTVQRWSPWLPRRPLRRTCPRCAGDATHGTALIWHLPLVQSCFVHGCRLEDTIQLNIGTTLDEPLPPVPVSAHLAALDRHTYHALTTGEVALPRRSVHAGIWFRLLRTLLDELTVCPSRLGPPSASTVRCIWRHFDQPVRAGLESWRPYELLDQSRQAILLEAAAVTLDLAEHGTITARGTLGSLLTPEPHHPVGHGDPPIPARPERARPSSPDDHMHHAMTALENAIAEARTTPDSARKLLNLATYASHTVSDFAHVRKCLLELDVPAEFLPNHHELGRTDLT